MLQLTDYHSVFKYGTFVKGLSLDFVSALTNVQQKQHCLSTIDVKSIDKSISPAV